MSLAKRLTAVLLIFSLMAISCNAFAATVPYVSYDYDQWDQSIPSAVGYLPTTMHYGDVDGKVTFSGPEDFYVDDATGDIVVADTGNNRIVILDSSYHLVRVLDSFTMKDGSEYSLMTPKGVFVRNDRLYIADYDNMNVVVSDMSGKIERLIQKPANASFPQESEFRPLRVVADSHGNVYVLVMGVYQGAVTFTADGVFSRYYGSNTVALNAGILADRFWKKLMSKEQKSQISNYVPVTFTSFDITDNDFVYSCTQADNDGHCSLRKMNPVGDNLWKTTDFGDREIAVYKNKMYSTSFVDVAGGENDFVFALDSTKGRIFMYDDDGNPAFTFGGKGNQMGTFYNPTAIETYGEEVLVLDADKCSITTFEPTEYGRKVKQALVKFSNGDYTSSRSIWEDVLKENANLYVAYIGIGKACYYSGNYSEAMRYFRLGEARANESKAFSESRTQILRNSIPAMLTIVGVLVVAWIVWKLIRKIRQKRGHKA